jgi:hypothetical protein
MISKIAHKAARMALTANNVTTDQAKITDSPS